MLLPSGDSTASRVTLIEDTSMRYSAAERLFDFGSNLFDFKPRRASNALHATTKVTGNSNCKVKSKSVFRILRLMQVVRVPVIAKMGDLNRCALPVHLSR
jgi:hypothetical protein